MVSSISLRAKSAFAVSLVLTSLAAPLSSALAAGPAPVAVDQGSAWSPEKRDRFYSLDQGSCMMPLRWINALKQPDRSPFMADSLRRYGFLPNAASPAMLPVGFTADGPACQEEIGMTCAACHTRQIEYGGMALRIDGGPAIIDFQSFLSDLDAAVATVLNNAAIFGEFAAAVIGSTHTPAEDAALRKELGDWHHRYHTLMRNALPPTPWGPGRADAMGMIFNRLAGLDLGKPPTYVIELNMARADAPVRYPFLWNAARQNKTQWPGFAPNNHEYLRLGRNLGQLFGVFGKFHPTKDPASGKFSYLPGNSANFDGLKELENLMMDIGPPRWPWAINETLAKKGESIFNKECGNACHEIKEAGGDLKPTWETPVVPTTDVKTDTRQVDFLNRPALSGVLEGADPAEQGPLTETDTAKNILTAAVIGSILEHLLSGDGTNDRKKFESDKIALNRLNSGDVIGYEARVLQGIWAAAPYLHNGSVPTLADLLTAPDKRPISFKVGSAYDPARVGLAEEQMQFDATLTTTDCGDTKSGNSRCGHEYGTDLQPEEKEALLEYLKQL